MKQSTDSQEEQTEFDIEKWDEYEENFLSRLIGVPQGEAEQYLQKTILEPLGISLQESGDHDLPKMLLEYFQSLDIARDNVAGRFFQAALNMNLAEMQILQTNGVKHLIATGCAFGFALAQQDKTLASFILDNTELKSNIKLLSVIVSEQYDDEEEDFEFYDYLFNLGLDLTFSPADPEVNCVFFEMIGNLTLSEEYLISKLPQVHNVNVENKITVKYLSNVKPEDAPNISDRDIEEEEQIEPTDSLLMKATARGYLELAKKLVSMGADISYSYTQRNHQSSVWKQTLHANNKELINLLLDKVSILELKFDVLPQLLHSLEEDQISKRLSECNTSNLDLSAPYSTAGSCIFSILLSSPKLSEGFLIALLPYVKDVNAHNGYILQFQNSRGVISYEDLESQSSYSFLMEAITTERFELAKKLVGMGADVNYSYNADGWQGSVLEECLRSGEISFIQFILGTSNLIVPENLINRTFTIDNVTLPITTLVSCIKARGVFEEKAATCTDWLGERETHNDMVIHSLENLKNAIKYFTNPTNAGTEHPMYAKCFDDTKFLMLKQIEGYFNKFWDKCMLVCKVFSPPLGDGQHIEIPGDIVTIIGSFVFQNLLTELKEPSQVIEVTGEVSTDEN